MDGIKSKLGIVIVILDEWCFAGVLLDKSRKMKNQ